MGLPLDIPHQWGAVSIQALGHLRLLLLLGGLRHVGDDELYVVCTSKTLSLSPFFFLAFSASLFSVHYLLTMTCLYSPQVRIIQVCSSQNMATWVSKERMLRPANHRNRYQSLLSRNIFSIYLLAAVAAVAPPVVLGGTVLRRPP